MATIDMGIDHLTDDRTEEAFYDSAGSQSLDVDEPRIAT